MKHLNQQLPELQPFFIDQLAHHIN